MSQYYVLGRRTIFEDLILADENGGRPLLFASEDEAWEHFRANSKGHSAGDLQVFVRKAEGYELNIGIKQGATAWQ